MAEDTGKARNGGLQDLIQVTEERTRAEERVRSLLSRIAEDQAGVRDELSGLAAQVLALSHHLVGLQQMIAVVVDYMAVIAGRDQAETREMRDRMLDRITRTSGITFGDRASVDIGGDMVGGDETKGEG